MSSIPSTAQVSLISLPDRQHVRDGKGACVRVYAEVLLARVQHFKYRSSLPDRQHVRDGKGACVRVCVCMTWKGSV